MTWTLAGLVASTCRKWKNESGVGHDRVDFFGVESFGVDVVDRVGGVDLLEIDDVDVAVPRPPGSLGVAHEDAFEFLRAVLVTLCFVFVGDGQVHDQGSERPNGSRELGGETCLL